MTPIVMFDAEKLVELYPTPERDGKVEIGFASKEIMAAFENNGPAPNRHDRRALNVIYRRRTKQIKKRLARNFARAAQRKLSSGPETASAPEVTSAGHAGLDTNYSGVGG